MPPLPQSRSPYHRNRHREKIPLRPPQRRDRQRHPHRPPKRAPLSKQPRPRRKLHLDRQEVLDPLPRHPPHLLACQKWVGTSRRPLILARLARRSLLPLACPPPASI